MQLKVLHTTFLNQLRLIYESREASILTDIVFEHFANADKKVLIKDPNLEIPGEICRVIEQALSQLKDHKPIQYIIGETWFYKMKFKVSPAVLIPRPETEELVTEAITFLRSPGKSTVLDIGTGSGCIPISIKKNLPGTVVSAIDVSEAALDIAKENAGTQETEISWQLMNFLDETLWTGLARYDVIISNPPYIPENEKDKLHKNVTAYEPAQALFVADHQPLVFYEAIARFGMEHLAEEGKIFMETHEDYGAEVASHFNSIGYRAIVKKDLSGKQRMVIAIRYPLP
jgi:release factor glutamine methyltransferase